MEPQEIDRRRNYIVMLDTETANDLECPLTYDIGWAIIDKWGTVYRKRSFVNREIFFEEAELMQSSYYAHKLPLYYKRIAKGETKVANVLDVFSVEYERQYVFEDCRDKLPLPFDFYIEKYCLIIEYDGQQHFKPVDFAGKGEEWSIQNMRETQRRDAIKNQYCEDNNINILRIPYWEFDDIEKLIKDKLNSLK